MALALKRGNAISVLVAALLAVACLTSCGGGISWDRSYNLRQWEKIRISAEAACVEGDYAGAEKLLDAAVQYAEALGAGNFRIAATLSLLGDALMRQGKLTDARARYEQALARLDASLKQPGTDFARRMLEEDRARVLLNLGNISLQTGDLSEAQSCFQQSISLYKQRQDAEDLHVLAEDYGTALLGMGMVKLRQGDARAAATIYKEALAAPAAEQFPFTLKERLKRLQALASKGDVSAEKIQTIESTEGFQEAMLAAKEFYESKKFLKAEKQYELAIERGKTLLLDDGKMAAAYMALGKLQQNLLLYRKAVRNLEVALSYKEKLRLAPGDEDTDWLYTEISTLHHRLHEDAAARDYLVRQLKLLKQSEGEGSIFITAALARLCEVDFYLGKNAEARQEALRAWKMVKDSGWNSGKARITSDILARVFFALGLYKESRAASDLVLEITRQEKHLPAAGVQAIYRLAGLEAQAGNVEKSAALIAEAIIDEKNIEFPLELLLSTSREAALLSTHEQLKGAAIMANAAGKLADRLRVGDAGGRLTKGDALMELAIAEAKLGNNERAAFLKAEGERLYAAGLKAAGN